MSFRRKARQSSRRLLRVEYGEDCEIVRQAAGSRNEYGEFVPGATTTEPVRMAVEPATAGPLSGGENRDMQPSGARLRDVKRFFLPSNGDVAPIRVGTSQTEADVIRYAGTDYSVVRVDSYEAFGHIEILGMRPDVC